jgi:hypothetical protein
MLLDAYTHSIDLVGPCDIRASEGPDATAVPMSIEAYNGDVLPTDGHLYIIDLAGLATPGSVPVLTDHINAVDKQAGSVTPRTDGKRLWAEGSLASKSKAGSEVMAGHKGGSKYQASVGVTPIDVERVAPGHTVTVNGRQFTADRGGLEVVRRGRLNEISITPIGVDRTTSVTIAASEQLKGSTMTTPDIDALVEAQVEKRMQAIEAKFEAKQLQRDRLAGILGNDPILATAVAENWTLERAELHALRAGMPGSPMASAYRDSVSINAAAGHSAPRHRPAGIQEAIQAKLDILANGISAAEKSHTPHALEMAERIGAEDYAELCRDAFRLAGFTPAGGREDIIKAADINASGGGVSLVNMPVAQSNVVGIQMRRMYDEAASPWQKICYVDSVSALRSEPRVQPSAPGEMKPLGDGEAISSIEGIEESSYDVEAETFAIMGRLTRKQQINDRIGFLSQLSGILGNQWIRTLNNAFAKTIMVATDASYWTAANAKVGSGYALSIESLNEALSIMRKAVGKDGFPIDVQPKTVLIPPELEQMAKECLLSEYTERIATEADLDSVRGTGNPLRGSVGFEIDPRLSNAKFTNYSATTWYLFGRTTDRAVTVVFMNNRRVPFIEFVQPDDQHLTTSYKCYGEFKFQRVDKTAAARFKVA